jgi:hypothetical protein
MDDLLCELQAKHGVISRDLSQSAAQILEFLLVVIKDVRGYVPIRTSSLGQFKRNEQKKYENELREKFFGF